MDSKNYKIFFSTIDFIIDCVATKEEDVKEQLEQNWLIKKKEIERFGEETIIEQIKLRSAEKSKLISKCKSKFSYKVKMGKISLMKDDMAFLKIIIDNWVGFSKSYENKAYENELKVK